MRCQGGVGTQSWGVGGWKRGVEPRKSGVSPEKRRFASKMGIWPQKRAALLQDGHLKSGVLPQKGGFCRKKRLPRPEKGRCAPKENCCLKKAAFSSTQKGILQKKEWEFTHKKPQKRTFPCPAPSARPLAERRTNEERPLVSPAHSAPPTSAHAQCCYNPCNPPPPQRKFAF